MEKIGWRTGFIITIWCAFLSESKEQPETVTIQATNEQKKGYKENIQRGNEVSENSEKSGQNQECSNHDLIQPRLKHVSYAAFRLVGHTTRSVSS